MLGQDVHLLAFDVDRGQLVDRRASTAAALMLAGGMAAYLVALAGIRQRLRSGSPWPQLAAALAMSTASIGRYVSAPAQVAALAAVLITAAILAE